jgi:uncharacterized protein (TIGR00730 family)
MPRREQHSRSETRAEAGRTPLIGNVCVYCGSAAGVDPLYEDAARQFGRILALAGVGLVYGGSHRGLMGVIAQAALEAGGQVTGIIPEFLIERSDGAQGAEQHVVVSDMHTRKRLMFERADAFVALPGGVGTLEELVEQLTWLQLERHTKPVVIADIGGFWRPLLALFAHMRAHRFIQPQLEVRYLVAETVHDILPMMQAAAARHAALGLSKDNVDPRL